MFSVLGKVKIEDLQKFVGVFSTKGAEMRKKYGGQHSQIFRVQGEDNRVYVLLEWTSKEAFEEFANSPMVKETMKTSGTIEPPEFIYLEKIGEFPA